MPENVATCRSHTILIAGCSTAIAALAPVALFQFGIVHHLPDPPGHLFASDHITSSKDAHPFGVPDGLLGLASYGTTLALAIRAPRSRLARSALGAKLLLDGGMAAVNTVKQFVKFRRACSWCMVTAAATAVMVAAGRRDIQASSNASRYTDTPDCPNAPGQERLRKASAGLRRGI